ncbi:MAG: hypothetical protein IJO43_01875 [Bacilli bacterium]|nr:hypothetical protein [Bacilli bacterium]
MKKFKGLFLMLILISIALLIPKVDAISVNLIEEHDNISIPWIIYDTGSKITVYDTENYDLYGQWLEITIEQYNTIKDINDRCSEISKEGNAWRSENYPYRDNFESDEEYSAAVEAFDKKIHEYNERIDSCNTEYYETIPNFDDTKWEKLTDDTVYLPSESFSGTRPFVLYVKLDDKTNSLIDYEVAVLELDGEDDDAETTMPEVDDTNWQKLKDGIKNNETIALFNNDESSVSFDDTDNSKFIIEVEQDGKTYVFTLNYRDGIMTYDTDTSSPEGYEFINSTIIDGVLQEYCKLFDYNNEAFMTWLLDNEGKLTLVGNGITYSIKEYNYENNGEGYDFSLSGEYFESLSINIAYPLTGFTNQAIEEEKEPNPGTGDLSMVVIAGAMLICAGASFVVYRKMKQN